MIIESFLLKRQRCNIDTPIKIQAKQVMNNPSNKLRPKSYFNIPSDLKTMITRIVNTLQNGPLKFPNILIDDYVVIIPVETIKYCVNELNLLIKLNK